MINQLVPTGRIVQTVFKNKQSFDLPAPLFLFLSGIGCHFSCFFRPFGRFSDNFIPVFRHFGPFFGHPGKVLFETRNGLRFFVARKIIETSNH